MCSALHWLVCGLPEAVEALFCYDMVGYDRSELILRGTEKAGVNAVRDWFQMAYLELVRAGCGIGPDQGAA